MDRIKRLVMDILAVHKEKFGTDFKENKKILNQVSIVRSKVLKNELAGYITKFIKREIAQQKEKEERAIKASTEDLNKETDSQFPQQPSPLDESIQQRQKEILSQTSE